MCAALSSHYEHLLNAAVVLALFIPVVLALAESVSIQSVTLTLQNMQSGPVQWKQFGRALTTELMTALFLGIACGCTVGLASWVWKREALVAVVLAGSIAAAMFTACAFGVVLPTLLRLAKADPKIAAGPIVLAHDRSGGVALLLHHRRTGPRRVTAAGWPAGCRDGAL